MDFFCGDDQRFGSSHSHTFRVVLPNEVASAIMDKKVRKRIFISVTVFVAALLTVVTSCSTVFSVLFLTICTRRDVACNFCLACLPIEM